ncbi:MAG: hypothetical protein KF755_03130 [Burkholderiaceae bacterium]|nr:hypothetical protein [Burkholderiaceae bacterium]
MEPDAIYLLQRLRLSAELNAVEVGKLIPRYFGDHRDFFTLARLLEGGYVARSATPEKVPHPFRGVDVRAILLYMDAHELTEYRGVTANRHSGKDDNPLFLTAAGMLALEQFETKRADRLWSTGIAVAAAILSAVATAFAVNVLFR